MNVIFGGHTSKWKVLSGEKLRFRSDRSCLLFEKIYVECRLQVSSGKRFPWLDFVENFCFFWNVFFVFSDKRILPIYTNIFWEYFYLCRSCNVDCKHFLCFEFFGVWLRFHNTTSFVIQHIHPTILQKSDIPVRVETFFYRYCNLCEIVHLNNRLNFFSLSSNSRFTTRFFIHNVLLIAILLLFLT